MNKFDFQQLIKDVNGRNPSQSFLSALPRSRLTLTDTKGIPLGYERTSENTEFEAGQLFERYDDKLHTGGIDQIQFLIFFHDFQSQLLPFYHRLYYQNDLGPSYFRSSPAGDHGPQPHLPASGPIQEQELRRNAYFPSAPRWNDDSPTSTDDTTASIAAALIKDEDERMKKETAYLEVSPLRIWSIR